jgi:hypothetical protein
MAELQIRGDHLVLELSMSEWVFGLVGGDISVPLSAVSAVRVVRPARDGIRGIRAPGTGWPGVIALGHWRARGVHDFVAVYGNHAGVVVELTGQRFDRLVVSVDDPEAVAAAIQAA